MNTEFIDSLFSLDPSIRNALFINGTREYDGALLNLLKGQAYDVLFTDGELTVCAPEIWAEELTAVLNGCGATFWVNTQYSIPRKILRLDRGIRNQRFYVRSAATTCVCNIGAINSNVYCGCRSVVYYSNPFL